MASGSAVQTIPAVLTIAGSDSGGGAGIQADIKTFTSLRCYGTSVITALTAQNTTGVQGVHPCPPSFVKQQLSSVLDDLSIRAIKTGMLYDADTIRVVASTLKTHYAQSKRRLPTIICDPVSVSTSGHSLLTPDAIQVLIDEMFPLAALITPNKAEAEAILSCRGSTSSINNVEQMLSASWDLLQLGSQAVLLKGGHIITTPAEIEQIFKSYPHVSIIKDGLLEDNMEILQRGQPQTSAGLVVDVLHYKSAAERVTSLFVRPRINTTSTHGTGCTLSAAIACGFAQGLSLSEAVRMGTLFTHYGIETAFPMGGGNGPLNHVHSIIQRVIPLATESNRFPLTRILIKSTSSTWKSYVEHPFVKELGRGVLKRGYFIHFMKQDYHYLRYYARSYALLAAKSSTFDAIESSTRTIENIMHEVSTTHRIFCGRWGITEEDLQATPESEATTAYGAFILDVGLQGDAANLTIALAACLLGYGEVGLWLLRESQREDTWVIMDESRNPYVHWIEDYAGERFQEAVKLGLAAIEKIAHENPPTQRKFEEWKAIWERCVRLEKGFWDMAMNLS